MPSCLRSVPPSFLAIYVAKKAEGTLLSRYVSSKRGIDRVFVPFAIWMMMEARRGTCPVASGISLDAFRIWLHHVS